VAGNSNGKNNLSHAGALACPRFVAGGRGVGNDDMPMAIWRTIAGHGRQRWAGHLWRQEVPTGDGAVLGPKLATGRSTGCSSPGTMTLKNRSLCVPGHWSPRFIVDLIATSGRPGRVRPCISDQLVRSL
jgi:hypothetical protein